VCGIEEIAAHGANLRGNSTGERIVVRKRHVMRARPFLFQHSTEAFEGQPRVGQLIAERNLRSAENNLRRADQGDLGLSRLTGQALGIQHAKGGAITGARPGAQAGDGFAGSQRAEGRALRLNDIDGGRGVFGFH